MRILSLRVTNAVAAAVLTVVVTAVLAGAMVGTFASPAAAADGVTVCFDATLDHTKTEVDADLTVAQFDPGLGTLLDVTVPNQSVHLDTDAAFESTARSAVVFAEHMDYQVTFTSPGGLPSPGVLAGTIQRVPSQTLAAFDGTLDYLGASAVTEAPTVRDAAATALSANDPPTLSAFTGTGTMAFHIATMISETFNGGGGNVEAKIETFASATLRVCYRYAPPPIVVTPATVPPSLPPATVLLPDVVAPAAESPSVSAVTGPTTVSPALPDTGSSSGLLVGLGAIAVGIGAALAWRARSPRATLDL